MHHDVCQKRIEANILDLAESTAAASCLGRTAYFTSASSSLICASSWGNALCLRLNTASNALKYSQVTWHRDTAVQPVTPSLQKQSGSMP